MVWLLVFVFLILDSPSCSSGSTGDRSNDFRSCVSSCNAALCDSTSEKKVDWLLGVMGWTCLEDCQYNCMHEVTVQDLQHNRTIRQFFGKVCLHTS